MHRAKPTLQVDFDLGVLKVLVNAIQFAFPSVAVPCPSCSQDIRQLC